VALFVAFAVALSVELELVLFVVLGWPVELVLVVAGVTVGATLEFPEALPETFAEALAETMAEMLAAPLVALLTATPPAETTPGGSGWTIMGTEAGTTVRCCIVGSSLSADAVIANRSNAGMRTIFNLFHPIGFMGFRHDQVQQISWISVLVKRVLQMGHLRLRIEVVFSMHFLQKMCGQVFSTTSRSRSVPQLHNILALHASSSFFTISYSVFELNWRSLSISRFFFSLSSSSLDTTSSFSFSCPLSCCTTRYCSFPYSLRRWLVSRSLSWYSWNFFSSKLLIYRVALASSSMRS
jgi:hypothetical protein